MKPKLLLRLAAGCLLFFAVGHSIGHVSRHSVSDPLAQEVLRQMSIHKFDMFGQKRSYDENYTGMSLNLIFTLIAFATILWMISSFAEQQPRFSKNLLIPIACCTLGFSITSYLYFFPVPAVSSLVASILSGVSVLILSKRPQEG
ncbi:MAG: hypothetical protein K2Q22_05100 [Cytophagales bacterium]|nr:hypothetical protein [Cytophagales bacterium]